jgi:histidine phosphotransfer protein HptB
LWVGVNKGREDMIKWARVRELKDEVGEDSYFELQAIFLAEVEEALTRLTPARSAGELEADLHFLKGSALNIGLARLAELCHYGEQAAKTGTLVPEALSTIIETYATSRAELLAGEPQPA